MKDRAVVFFMLVVLIDTIGFGIVIAVMPKLLEHAGGVFVGPACNALMSAKLGPQRQGELQRSGRSFNEAREARELVLVPRRLA